MAYVEIYSPFRASLKGIFENEHGAYGAVSLYDGNYKVKLYPWESRYVPQLFYLNCPQKNVEMDIILLDETRALFEKLRSIHVNVKTHDQIIKLVNMYNLSYRVLAIPLPADLQRLVFLALTAL